MMTEYQEFLRNTIELVNRLFGMEISEQSLYTNDEHRKAFSGNIQKLLNVYT